MIAASFTTIVGSFLRRGRVLFFVKGLRLIICKRSTYDDHRWKDFMT